MAYRKRTRVFPKKRAFKKTRAVKKRPAIRKMVRAEIARNVENKCAQTKVLLSNVISSASTSFDTTNVIPVAFGPTTLDVQQGTGQAGRIGNQIKVKKLTFKGTVIPTIYNVTTNPLPKPYQVKMWIFYDKVNPTQVPTPKDDFFQFGGSVIGFQNDLVDLWAPVNTDKYRVLATRQWKIGGANPDNTNGYLANNDFKFNANFSVNLTKHIPQIVRYRDTNTTPTSRGVFAMFACCAADGGQTPSAYIPVSFCYMLDAQYEDA